MSNIDDYIAMILQWREGLKRFDAEALQVKLPEGGWSVGQVYQHVLDEACFHIEQINKCLTSAEDFVDGQPTEEGARMLRQNDFPDIRIAGPMTNVAIPQPVCIQDLDERLSTVLASMQTLADQPNFNLKAGKVRHPGLGWLTAAQWLQFSEMHFRHHLRQIKRLNSFILQQKN